MIVQLLNFATLLISGLFTFVIFSGSILLCASLVGVLVKLRTQQKVRTERHSLRKRCTLCFLLPVLLAGLSTPVATLFTDTITASQVLFAVLFMASILHGVVAGFTVMADALLKEQWRAVVMFLLVGYVIPIIFMITIFWAAITFQVPGFDVLPHPD